MAQECGPHGSVLEDREWGDVCLSALVFNSHVLHDWCEMTARGMMGIMSGPSQICLWGKEEGEGKEGKEEGKEGKEEGKEGKEEGKEEG
ncbi:hypothetical protein ACOMHN_005215 [Nucella lapillus]